MEVVVVAIVGVIATVVAGAVGGWIGAKVEVDAEERSLGSLRRQLEELVRKAKGIMDALDFKKLGVQLYRAGQDEEAVALLTEALSRNDEDLEARYYRGMAQKRLDDAVEARTDLLYVAEHWHPWDGVRLGDVWRYAAEEARDLGWWHDVEAEAKSAIREGTGDAPGTYCLLGESLFRQKFFEEALDAYDACLRLSRKKAEAIEGKGAVLMALARRGDRSFDEVTAHYSAAISENPGWAKYYIYRGIAYLERGENGDDVNARQDFEKAQDLNPADGTAWREHGRALYEEAMEEWPTLSSTARDLLHLAKDHLEHAVSLTPDRAKPNALNWLSLILQSLGKTEQAVDTAQKSVQLGAHSTRMWPQNHQALVCALLHAGRWNDAHTTARSWLTAAKAREHLPSRILLEAWAALAAICDGTSPTQPELEQIARDLAAIPGFRTTWDWRPARYAVKTCIEKLGSTEATASSAQILQVLEGQSTLGEFQEWLRKR